jgi:hypothetical protein
MPTFYIGKPLIIMWHDEAYLVCGGMGDGGGDLYIYAIKSAGRGE